MFERFNDRARQVIVHAQEEARLLSHNYLGTEHILLGIARDGGGVAVEALTALDVSLQAMRQQVVQIIGIGASTPSGHIPFTPRAKKVLELALRESLELGDDYIGAEHILLGLVREGEGVAAQVLVRLGVDLNRARRQVMQLKQHPGEDVSEPEIPLAGPRPGLRAARPGALGSRPEGWEAVIPVLADIQRRLTMIERHVGISQALGMTAADESDQPQAPARPGSGGQEPVSGPDSAEPGDPTRSGG